MMDSLALRLLKIIFGSYFVVTLVVTFFQLYAEYQHTKKRVETELQAMEQTFGPGITSATWRYQDEVQRSILNGISHLPIVTGVKIQDSHGQMTHAAGAIIDNDGNVVQMGADSMRTPVAAGLFDHSISHQFPIIYVDEHGTEHPIGTWTVYSNHRVVLRQVEYGFFLILVNSIIKTAVLWFIFLYVFQRWLGKPISRLSAFVLQRDLDHLGDQKFALPGKRRHELHFLADAINTMLSGLQHAKSLNDSLYLQLAQEKESLSVLNASLEQRIAERTKDLQQANEQLELVSLTDALTGIANRRHFDQTFAVEWRRNARYATPLAVILVDVDWFKNYNDHYGHIAGDEVLHKVAQALRQSAGRAGDMVARYGGEEFVCIASNIDVQQGMELAQRICEAVFALNIPNAKSAFGRLTVSVGTASCIPKSEDEMINLLQAADAALYRAKLNGRNHSESAPQISGASSSEGQL